MAVRPETAPHLPDTSLPDPSKGTLKWAFRHLPLVSSAIMLGIAGTVVLTHDKVSSAAPVDNAPLSDTIKPPVGDQPSLGESFDCGILSPEAGAGEYIEFNTKPATGCNLTSQSEVISPVNIVDTKQFILPPFRQEDPIGLNQSFILGDSCYTITYTVPYDSEIVQITQVPLNKGSKIITLGSASFKVEDKDFNLILYLQKRPLENGQTDHQKCPVYNIDPANFGEHQQITSDLFKNELE